VIRLFVASDLSADRPVGLERAQSHYLVDVMRLAEGAEIAVFNGRDGEWLAKLTRRSKLGWALVPTVLARAQRPGPDLDLLVALIRRSRLETVVEKAAELGARRVRLVITERANPARANLQRLTAIATEAAEQTGRMDVPEILAPESLADVLAAWDGERRLMFCDEAGEAPMAIEALVDCPPAVSWAILIGPEGGFSASERGRIRATPGALPAGLGPRILRSDTAAICAMTLWQAQWGDWRGT
jgi:16S rRNA (uracil1498-N3)-methyltransferase